MSEFEKRREDLIRLPLELSTTALRKLDDIGTLEGDNRADTINRSLHVSLDIMRRAVHNTEFMVELESGIKYPLDLLHSPHTPEDEALDNYAEEVVVFVLPGAQKSLKLLREGYQLSGGDPTVAQNDDSGLEQRSDPLNNMIVERALGTYTIVAGEQRLGHTIWLKNNNHLSRFPTWE